MALRAHVYLGHAHLLTSPFPASGTPALLHCLLSPGYPVFTLLAAFDWMLIFLGLVVSSWPVLNSPLLGKGDCGIVGLSKGHCYWSPRGRWPLNGSFARSCKCQSNKTGLRMAEQKLYSLNREWRRESSALKTPCSQREGRKGILKG